MGEEPQPSEPLGEELKRNNDKIVECILLLKTHRSELNYLIEKQRDERLKLETEVERITYKICLLNRSISQREQVKINYDNTLEELERKYARLVKDSGDLLMDIQKEFKNLDGMNKSTSTTDTAAIESPTDLAACGEKEDSIITCKCEASANRRVKSVIKIPSK